jgi:hypothetical protein
VETVLLKRLHVLVFIEHGTRRLHLACWTCAARILGWQVDLPLLAAAWRCDGWLAECL